MRLLDYLFQYEENSSHVIVDILFLFPLPLTVPAPVPLADLVDRTAWKIGSFQY